MMSWHGRAGGRRQRYGERARQLGEGAAVSWREGHGAVDDVHYSRATTCIECREWRLARGGSCPWS